MEKPRMIIDGGYLALRTKSISFFQDLVVNDKEVGLAFGMMNTLKKHVDDYTDFHIAWDKGFALHRQKLLDSYKSSRKDSIKPLISSEEQGFAETLLGFFGARQYYHPELEADDIIGYLSKNLEKPLHIYTTDKDLYQLVSKDIKILSPNNGLIGKDEVIEKFEVPPARIPDLLAIAGNRADDIDGIEGIGYKSASKYINEGLSSLSPNKASLIENNKDIIERNLKITRLKTDIPPKELAYDEDIERFRSLIDEYDMKSLKDLVRTKPKSITDFL